MQMRGVSDTSKTGPTQKNALPISGRAQYGLSFVRCD
jgi:hypothetical protein